MGVVGVEDFDYFGRQGRRQSFLYLIVHKEAFILLAQTLQWAGIALRVMYPWLLNLQEGFVFEKSCVDSASEVRRIDYCV